MEEMQSQHQTFQPPSSHAGWYALALVFVFIALTGVGLVASKAQPGAEPIVAMPAGPDFAKRSPGLDLFVRIDIQTPRELEELVGRRER